MIQQLPEKVSQPAVSEFMFPKVFRLRLGVAYAV